jgi:putative DNA primase/helicase
MLDLALHYARSGWPVFPLVAGGKIPLTAHGHKDASTSAAEIEQYWTRYPDANIGIATGRRSNVLVIDVDVSKTGWLDSLQTLALPQTFTVRTWSGGWHLYFAMPNERITIGAGLLTGIDWRGEGGYVVAAGSIVQGAHYEIARNVPIAPAPRSLIERLMAVRKNRVIAHDAGGTMVIAEPGRNQRLCAIGGALRRFGVGETALLDCLRAINAAHCRPALEDDEIAQIAHSVARYAPAERSRA